LPDVLLMQKVPWVLKIHDDFQHTLSHCQNAYLNISPFM
jgi:hypothetical protein